MQDIEKRIEDILLLVQKPERYIGGELGSIRKTPDAGMLKFALCFPEVYELGASHLGGRIIYHIINKMEKLLCERFYAPWVDMRDQLKEKNIPLFSLESKRPLNEFDVIGFSLHYELTYTNILEMLHLGGVPIRASERGETLPILIAGGTSAFNPEPLAPIFDIFYLGDAEGLLPEVLEFIRENRNMSKNEILLELCKWEGLYVPSFYEPTYEEGKFAGMKTKNGLSVPVRSYYVKDLLLENYPNPPILPWLEITHDRLDIEIMRGCTRGCRFCMPGYIYRPLREKNPDDIIQEIETGIEKTGWRELSLLSLSTPDYSAIKELAQTLKVISRDKVISVATPSIRADSTQDYLLDLVKEVRKSALTFAPETGSERLRKVINKPLNEDEMIDAIVSANRMGWKKIKLYFMVGLPTETIADLEESASLIEKIQSSIRSSNFNIKVSISPFVPKPHTPFQWERQISNDEVLERYKLIMHNIRNSRIEFDTRNPDISYLEGVFCRGDRRLFDVIYEAWRKGAYLDAWFERFDISLWLDTFNELGVEPNNYLKAKDTEIPLPWSHISSGATKEYLLKEKELAYHETTTPDCRLIECQNCNKCDFEKMVKAKKQIEYKSKDTLNWGRTARKSKSAIVYRSYLRIKYSKEGRLRFLSHLSLIRLLTRAVRRSDLPIAYSSGFTQRPKIAFSQPLPLGFSSSAEYMDLQFTRPLANIMITKLQEALPEDIRIIEYKQVPDIKNSLFSEINYSYYTVELTVPYSEERLMEFKNGIPKILTIKDKPINITEFILEIALEKDNGAAILHLILENKPKRTLRPDTFLEAAGFGKDDIARLNIKREEQLIRENTKIFTPLGEIWGEVKDGKIIRNPVERV
ncbi:TIGR03960 family B12-binding radical SAM protein [bacterium]|nr:TIGR03960 family B12-binding radical SAM protein [bacterium]